MKLAGSYVFASMVDYLPWWVVIDKGRVAHTVWHINRQHLRIMTRRTEVTKSTVSKKDRREQNRINQQSFRERKRKEFEDLRAELESIKASQIRTSDDKSIGASIDADRPGHFAQPKTPSDATPFGTPAESKVQRRAVPMNELPNDTTLDPSLLALSSSTDFGSSHAPYRPDMPESNDWGATFGGPPSTDADLGYTYVPHYDPGSALQNQPSSFDQACDGMPSAPSNMSSNTIYAPNISLPADPIASITADYMNAQLLAFKSAEWYARAAEVGIKIATTRQNAWLDKSMLWPQWSLGDASRGALFSGTEGTVGLDCMSTDTSTYGIPPQPMNFPDPWYPMLPQDWQQTPSDMRDIAT